MFNRIAQGQTSKYDRLAHLLATEFLSFNIEGNSIIERLPFVIDTYLILMGA